MHCGEYTDVFRPNRVQHDIRKAPNQPLARSDAGFFLMVEGGRIDYGGHDNDAGAMLNEILDFDAALGAGIVFQRARPETLIIVTADHGTGGFTVTYGEFDGQPEAQVLCGVPRRSPPNTGTIRGKSDFLSLIAACPTEYAHAAESLVGSHHLGRKNPRSARDP